MKRFKDRVNTVNRSTLNLMLSAVLGSAITLGGFWLIDRNHFPEEVRIKYVQDVPVQNAFYGSNNGGEAIPLDFTSTAEAVMPSVVHIRSAHTVSQPNVRSFQYRGVPDPFRDFFGDEYFERFFGPFDRRSQEQPRNDFRQQSTGSGVIINENGYIVTNNHVIANADEIEVTLYDNRTFEASVIGADPTTDLALIRVDARDLHALPLVDSDGVKVGEWVLAVGNPFNLNSTVTAGIVSAKARNINILQDRYAIESFIQTDAAINPGNSGGALVNLQGGLIGINTAIASPTGAYAGYGFAVPSNMVSKIVEDLLKYGSVQRGFLGVTIRGVNGRLAKEKELEVITGVYVDSVAENSSAKEAGIQPGDVILEVEGQKVTTSPQLQEQIARFRPGDKVTLKIDRFGREKEFDVVLRNRNGEEEIVSRDYPEILTSLGADFEEIDKDAARKLNIDGGVRITRLYPGRLKRDTKIKEGFILTQVDNEPVSSIKDLSKSLKGKTGGILLEGIYENDPEVYYYGLGMSS